MSGEITIGRLGIDDTTDLMRLAERDTSETPAGLVIGARVDGRLIAAMSVTSGESVADPFVSTEGIRALLEERAGQLRGNGRGRFARLFRRGHARAALPASPPGAGGRLLEIQRG